MDTQQNSLLQAKIALEIRTPRTGLETPEAMAQFFGSLVQLKAPPANSFWKTSELPLSFEIAVFDQSIHFYIVIPISHQSFIESQLLSQYPRSLITPVKLEQIMAHFKDPLTYSYGQMKLQSPNVYPLKTYKDFKDIDPMSSLLGMMAKLSPEDAVLVQFLLIPQGNKWQDKGRKALEKKGSKNTDGTPIEDPFNLNAYAKIITEKISYPGLKTGIRILAAGPNTSLLGLTAATFTGFNNPQGNSLALTGPGFMEKKTMIKAILSRTGETVPSDQVLNILELATLFHLPGEKLSSIRNISWSKTILSDPPENLPVAQEISTEDKGHVNFFGRTEYKNTAATFGIRRVDRRKHMYIIGKTGVGKSTLIANMAINDIRNGEGVAVIDPHGDLSEILLDYIPSHRINDVAYLNPADMEHPFHLNPLEVDSSTQKELVASGIVSIFIKLYAHSWGPRLEYILRNTILTLLEVPNATMLMIPELLTNKRFRKRVVDKTTDPVLRNFWINEFEKMSDSQMNEAISPILNKVGQFLSSQIIRNIVGSPKSTINLAEAMDQGKIVILNLSQGKIGEDNSALLGAMIITKVQLAAMHRVNIAEANRRDFYMYVDEFQNFATSSFIKILSEARKYRLSLILANQYIGQIEEHVRSAIFGNAGTMLTFIIGAEDAPILAREFGERFKDVDLLSLGTFQMIVKMAIDGLTSSPFVAQSLPLPDCKNQNREKIIKVSQERYTKTGKEQPFDPDDYVVETQGPKEEKKEERKEEKQEVKKEEGFKPPTLNKQEIAFRLINKYK